MSLLFLVGCLSPNHYWYHPLQDCRTFCNENSLYYTQEARNKTLKECDEEIDDTWMFTSGKFQDCLFNKSDKIIKDWEKRCNKACEVKYKDWIGVGE